MGSLMWWVSCALGKLGGCPWKRGLGGRWDGRPASPRLSQPVKELRLPGSALWAEECFLAFLAPLPCVAPCFPVVFDAEGAVPGVVVPPPPPAPPPLPPPVPSPSVSVPPPPPLVLEGQLDVVIVFVSSVTAPVRASSLPWIVAPVFAVMLAEAMIVPTKLVLVPSVADEPPCQKTLHACAPFTSETLVPEPVISVEPIWKMNTALGLP